MSVRKSLSLIVALLMSCMIFAACEPKEVQEQKNGKDLVANTEDELFRLAIYLDQDTYSSGEVVFCYATLEYIGEKDSITVYSGDPMLGFGIKDDKLFPGGYSVYDILMPTTLWKGQVVRYDFSKSGGWSGDDPNASFYEQFYRDPNLILPPGEYEISAEMNCSLDQNDTLGSKYSQGVSVKIKVLE